MEQYIRPGSGGGLCAPILTGQMSYTQIVTPTTKRKINERYFGRLTLHIRVLNAAPGGGSRFVALPLLGLMLLCLAGCADARRTASDQEPVEIHRLLLQGKAFFQAGQYARASEIYEKGYEEASRQKNFQSALRFLANRGSVEYKLYHYRAAIRAYLRARDLATRIQDSRALSVILFNLSSLYNEMGELDAAFQAAQRGLAKSTKSHVATTYQPMLRIQLALTYVPKGDWPQASRLLQEAIDISKAGRDNLTESLALNELGNIFLERGQLGPAEKSILEAIQKAHGDSRLYFSYLSLARLRTLEGNTPEALHLLDQAIQAGRPLGPAAVWNAYYERGVAERSSAPLAAFHDLETSLELLRSWRAEIVPADIFRVASEVKIQQIYSAFVDLASQLYWQTGEKRYAEAGFQATDENRSVSLKAFWTESNLTKNLPEEYRRNFSELARLEAGLLNHSSSSNTDRSPMLVRLAELEAETALNNDSGQDNHSGQAAADVDQPSRRAQQLLGPDDLYLYFHVSSAQSSLWALTSDQFQLYKLPARSELEDLIRRFLLSVREDKPDSAALGQQLYTVLFGAVAPGALARPHWILAPDGPLFDLPFAALVSASAASGAPSLGRRERYLVEDHSLELVPNTSALLYSKPAPPTHRFVGIGDPVYNRADPRQPSSASLITRVASMVRPDRDDTLELARLGGSGREIEQSARIWRAHGYETDILKGPGATRQNVLAVLGRDAAVVHIAAHLIAPQDFAFSAIALSLEPKGPLEVLTTTDIAATPTTVQLVILSACNSGNGPILPGAGVMGMTRAWLASGARTVIATHWEITDADGGAFIETLYHHLSSQGPLRTRPVAEALRAAQLAALHAGDWRSKPFYWAAYFCVGRN
jgi:CHAT domain-containing protein